MIENTNNKFNFDKIMNILEDINPDYSQDKIKTYIEEFLLELFKEHILTIKITQRITVEDLRRVRTKLTIMKKSGRWGKKIDLFIKNYERDLNSLKLKNIQDSLRTSKEITKYDYLSAISNGSYLINIDNTFIEYNGNKEVSTDIKDESINLDHGDIQIHSSKKLLVDSKTSNSLKSDFPTDIGMYTDTLKEFEKIDKFNIEKEDVKIPIEADLVEKIRKIKLKPMEKKISKFTSMKDFKKYLDDMESSK